MAGYIAATRNEIATDTMFLSLVGLTPAGAGYLPRVPKWISFGKRWPRVTKLISLSAALLWVCGGAVALFALQYYKCRRQAPPQRLAIYLDEAGAVMAFCTRTGDILVAPEFANFPTLWITMPWAPLRSQPRDARTVDVHALLSRGDLGQCFRDAVLATYVMLRRAPTRPWILQSYTAFRWLCVRSAVDQLLPCQLVTTEHYDRWAVLADDAVRAAHRAGGRGAASTLTMVQHGSLGRLGDDGASTGPALNLYRRMQSVGALYAYGAMAEASFRADILGASHRLRAMSVSYFRPAITLTAVAPGEGATVLFVGHPLAEPFHVAVHAALRQCCTVRAYYKPHPMAPMSAAMRQVGWTVVENPGCFPDVDLLISYESTLVVEYEGMGIAAQIHPINVGPEQAVRCAMEVRAKLLLP